MTSSTNAFSEILPKYSKFEFVHIESPASKVDEDMEIILLMCEQGIEKRLVIIHGICTDSKLCFRDENCRKIENVPQLFQAEIVFLTNDTTRGQIEGHILFDGNVIMKCKTLFIRDNVLMMNYKGDKDDLPTKTHILKDQASLFYDMSEEHNNHLLIDVEVM
ncbi:MAG: hypothetical protein Sylvanvirus21_5 [Sylvanvirus sp.]|uniref:Uncharacterized protein n=1 Tax=Sylvanvirus sp. TaxID=2487774 RepID=A0A3G5AL58_9VIRU|nr:MAG: hypothetical protein Sylvanvirus21_5 [Sylvanvirus sp.]